ncbi:MAG: SGNH hydrolase domain-containing protein [Ilumatobacteraceae bacterium]
MRFRIAIATMLLAGACSTADGSAQESEGTRPISPPTTQIATTTSTSSTTTTTTQPELFTGVLLDVVGAALLEAVPDGTPVASAAGDESPLYRNGCHHSWSAITPRDDCVFGDTTSDVVIVVTGDSHATAWFGAFDDAGKANHWKIVVVDKAGCPTADVSVYLSISPDRYDEPYTACDRWRRRALAYIALLEPDLVVFPMLSRRAVVGHSKASSLTEWGKGLGRSLDAVRGPGTKLLVIGDDPKTTVGNIPNCVMRHLDAVAACSTPRAAAVFDDRLAVIAEAARTHDATFVDPSNWFCTEDVCPAVIGNLVVYRDENHITDSFARYRAPQIADAIRFALASNP